MGSIATRWPTLKPLTSGPTSVIVPANSWPRISGRVSPVIGCGLPGGGTKIGPSSYSCRSVPQMPHQSTLSFTVPGRICGSGRSSTRTSPRP